MTDDTIRDQHDHTQDEPPEEGIKRRHVLACMAWAGTGLVGTFASGLLSSRTLGQAAAEQLATGQPARGDFTFVQISDTHIGFKGAANPDVMATLQLAIAKINALQPAPAFLLHTGTSPIARKRAPSIPSLRPSKMSRAARSFTCPASMTSLPMEGRSF